MSFLKSVSRLNDCNMIVSDLNTGLSNELMNSVKQDQEKETHL